MSLPDPPEPQPGIGPDRAVRNQIDAIKNHLTSEGLTAIEEPPIALGKAFEGFHTLVVQHAGTTRFLRLHYDWLDDHPTNAATWLRDEDVAGRLKADVSEIAINERGTITTKAKT
jgi:hypothetical protein